MEISLIIPAHNEEASIGICLDVVIKNGKGKFKEIIVVNNASTDKTAEIVARYPEVRLVSETRRGTGHARQTGAEHATGEILAYVDADTRIPEGWVEKIEHVFNKDPDVVLLSGPYRYHDTPWYRRWLFNNMWWVPLPIYWFVGYMANAGSLALRRSALEVIGGIDRKIEFYGDDTDIARRLSKVGKVLFRMNFFVYSSARRYDTEGIARSLLPYAVNYFSLVVLGRPFKMSHRNIRNSTASKSSEITPA